MKYIYVILLLYFNAQLIVAQGVGIGTRIDFTSKLGLNSSSGQFAQLFIPDYYFPPVEGDFTLVFHLHSASWAAENQVYKPRIDAILFNIHLGGLSSPYQTYFSNQNNFKKILDSIVAVLNWRGIIFQPVINKLIVTSFSAGYAGVREIFKTSSYYNMISALTLADGLHSNSEASTMIVQMSDFLRYAKDARDNRKVFLLTHSSITTSGYESTTQTANYLINGIGNLRQSFVTTDLIGTQYSKCDTGKFFLKGYYGVTADDHLKHLHNMDIMLKKAVQILDSSSLSIKQEHDGSQSSFHLAQNYPNPFNPTTVISWQSPVAGWQTLKIYDVLGNEVVVLFDDFRQAGGYEVEFNGSSLSSGVYFYRIAIHSDKLQEAGSSGLNYSSTKKLILMK